MEPKLPISVVSPVDLGRLIRELQAIDNTLSQQDLRQDEVKVPKTSKLLDELVELNKADLSHPTHRQALQEFLTDLRAHTPVVHISFSADPSPLFVGKVMTWLRQEVHPTVLMTIGLQPSIGAGCLVRTTNKYFDFTLRANFEKHHDLLMAKLREVNATPTPTLIPGVPEGVAA
ncbi:MAG: hypothetical protein JWN38_1059 [Candidatus Saccharibacteria bacterium]|nr:hypothetical protein [Candidatus Saccharibacteria bacterium]